MPITANLLQSQGLQSKNLIINGHRTSIRLEPHMWLSLKEIAEREGCKINELCSYIAAYKNSGLNMTGAIRLFLFLYYKEAATDEGHENAGHGRLKKLLSTMPALEEI